MFHDVIDKRLSTDFRLHPQIFQELTDACTMFHDIFDTLSTNCCSMYPVPRLIIDVPLTSVVLAVRRHALFKLCPAQAMTGAVAKGDMESLQEAQLAMAEYQKLIETAKKRKLEAEDNAPLTPRASAKSRAVASPRASAPVARAVAEAGAAASAVRKALQQVLWLLRAPWPSQALQHALRPRQARLLWCAQLPLEPSRKGRTASSAR